MSSSETSVRSSVRESHDVKVQQLYTRKKNKIKKLLIDMFVIANITCLSLQVSQDQKIQQNVASSFGNHFDEKGMLRTDLD